MIRSKKTPSVICKNNSSLKCDYEQKTSTVELQWLKHWWLVYHGYFDSVLESITRNPIAADIIVIQLISGDFLFCIDNGMLCVLIELPWWGDSNENTQLKKI